ncbi:hypothetical protein LPJ66_001649 [Kickxella alabastrina]|uniref:Uncharacterized protein n=1 Tax=Kickxella alabastrina TaxID=61397 RepID=A0ACC1ISY7_9FUNG|nr:hypothetical protein LPJ66_001649 [Kickxella alabastrina]
MFKSTQAQHQRLPTSGAEADRLSLDSDSSGSLPPSFTDYADSRLGELGWSEVRMSTSGTVYAEQGHPLNELRDTSNNATAALGLDQRAGASMLSSFFNLTNAIVGAGVIGLPYAMQQTGLLLGVVMILVLAWLVDWTLRILALNAKMSGRQSYQDLVDYCFGRWGLLANSFFQGAMAGGGMASFIVIVGDTLPHVLGSLFPSVAAGSVGRVVFSRRFVVAFFVVFLAYPLSLYRDIGKLGKTSAFAVVAMCTIIVSVVVEGPRIDAGWRAGPEAPVVLVNSGVFQAVGVITFAFVCHHNSFMIHGSLRKPTLDRYFGVVHLSTAIATVASLVIAVFGYLYFRDITQGNVLNNFPQDNLLINIARFLFALNMITTFPMETLVAREVLESLWFGSGCEFSLRRHVLVTTLLCGVGLFVGETVCNLGLLLELTGGMSASFLAFILPSACFIKLTSREMVVSKKTLPHWLCICFGLTVMVLSTVLSIRHAMKSNGHTASCW